MSSAVNSMDGVLITATYFSNNPPRRSMLYAPRFTKLGMIAIQLSNSSSFFLQPKKEGCDEAIQICKDLLKDMVISARPEDTEKVRDILGVFRNYKISLNNH